MAWTKAKTIVVVGIVVLLAATSGVVGVKLARAPQARAKAPDQNAAVTKMTDAKQAVIGMMIYARSHQNQFPTNFHQLASYFQSHPVSQQDLDQFELTYTGSFANIRNPASTIVVRERQPWRTAQGTWAKAYGFADGHSAIYVAPDGNFAAYERQHIMPPPTE